MNEEKNPVGRPSKYKDISPAKLAKILGELGLINEQIAEIMEIDEATFYRWKDKYPEFREAVDNSKADKKEQLLTTAYMVSNGYYKPEYRFNPDDPAFKNVGEDVKKLAEKIFKQMPEKWNKPDSKILQLLLMSYFPEFRIKTETTINDPIMEKVLAMTPEEKEKKIKAYYAGLEKQKPKKPEPSNIRIIKECEDE